MTPFFEVYVDEVCIAVKNEIERDIISLRFNENLSYGDIGSILGVSKTKAFKIVKKYCPNKIKPSIKKTYQNYNAAPRGDPQLVFDLLVEECRHYRELGHTIVEICKIMKIGHKTCKHLIRTFETTRHSLTRLYPENRRRRKSSAQRYNALFAS